MNWRIIEGDALERLRELPDESVHCCVTSPPYFGLRDYGTGEWDGGDAACDHVRQSAVSRASSGLDGATVTQGGSVAYGSSCGRCGATRTDRQIGLEPTPDEFVAALVVVFREVRRVLRDDGCVFLNLGDSYAGSQHGGLTITAPKPKDLLGIPWAVAFALRADGWYLRSEIIWAKPNPMPESVTDRPTKAHETIFLLSKQARYYFDADAIREPNLTADREGERRSYKPGSASSMNGGEHQEMTGSFAGLPLNAAGRNKRSVWEVATAPFAGAHFATFPPKLIEPCILAGSSPKACGVCGAQWQRMVERTPMVVRPSAKRAAWQAQDDHARTQVGGTMIEPSTTTTAGWEPTCEHDDDSGHSVVLDPFAGSGTTGMVALRHGRSFVGIELNPEYAQLARHRIVDDAPLMNAAAEAVA